DRLYSPILTRLSFFLLLRPPPTSTLFPYTTLFRSAGPRAWPGRHSKNRPLPRPPRGGRGPPAFDRRRPEPGDPRQRGSGVITTRSEEHTSELQSRRDLVCRLLLEKKKKTNRNQQTP